MAGDLTALASTWAGLGGTTTLAKLQAINSLNVASSHDVAMDTISSFIRNSGKLAGITSFATNPPSTPDATALKACNYFLAVLAGYAGVTIPAAQVPALLTILDAVANDARTGIASATALNAICQSPIPWWQANGFSAPITLYDLMAAGNLS
jgi:hypothetical protein